MRQARFATKLGHSYTIVVEHSRKAPRYIDAAPRPQRPHGRDVTFTNVGHDRRKVRVTITRSLHVHKGWNLGVWIGRTLHVLPITVRK